MPLPIFSAPTGENTTPTHYNGYTRCAKDVHIVYVSLRISHAATIRFIFEAGVCVCAPINPSVQIPLTALCLPHKNSLRSLYVYGVCFMLLKVAHLVALDENFVGDKAFS